MIRSILVKRLAYVFVFLALINIFATFLHWYHLVWWFDMPMHFLGGLAVFYLSAVLWLPARKWVSDRRYLFEVFITALFFGVAWEGLEFFLFTRFGFPPFHLIDATSDLFFDMSGSLVGVLAVIPLLKR